MADSSLWRDPEFLKLWIGQTISQIGSRVSREGLPLTAVLILNATPFQMGLLSGAGAATILLFGLFAGAWADRVRRRPILIVTDLGRMLVLGSIPLAAMLHHLTIFHLYIAAALIGILTVLFDVSYQAYLPSLVARENIVEGNSKLALTESIAEVIGPGVTGILVQLLTAPIAILVDAVSFLCSAISLLFIRKPEPLLEPVADPHMGREIAEGIRTCLHDPILRAMAGRTGTAAFFHGFYGGLYILFVMRELGLNAAVLGIIISIGGVSSLAGALISERVIRRFGPGWALISSALLIGGASLAIPLAHGSVAACSVFLTVSQLGDLAWPIYNISEVSLRQSLVPDRLLGRVNSAMHLLLRGALPLGALAGGALAEVIGVRQTLLIASAGVLLSTAWLFFSPVVRLRVMPAVGR